MLYKLLCMIGIVFIMFASSPCLFSLENSCFSASRYLLDIEPIFQTSCLLDTSLIPSSINQAFFLNTSQYLLNLSRSLILYIDMDQPSFIVTQTSWYIFDSSRPHPFFLTKIPLPIPFSAYTKLQFIGKCSKALPLFFSQAFHAFRPRFFNLFWGFWGFWNFLQILSMGYVNLISQCHALHSKYIYSSFSCIL